MSKLTPRQKRALFAKEILEWIKGGRKGKAPRKLRRGAKTNRNKGTKSRRARERITKRLVRTRIRRGKDCRTGGGHH